MAFCTFSSGLKVQVIADQFSAKSIGAYMHVALFFLDHMGIIDQRSRISINLHLVIAHARITSCKNFAYKIGKAWLIANVLMAFY
jgi:hypothetical protein